MTARRTRRRHSHRQPSRRLHHQTLERRELLAAEVGGLADAPRLVAVAANEGENFDLQDNNRLSVAPSELTFRFGGGQQLDPDTLSAIEFIPAQGDGSVDQEDKEDPNNRIIPGFLGFRSDAGERIVVARFAETLPDDQYLVEIAGYDDSDEGIVGLRNVDGDLFAPANVEDAAAPTQQIRFEVEVGPRVVSVVPQPIVEEDGTRVQQRNQVHVFFNDDPLSNPDAGAITTSDEPSNDLPVVRPEFYNLFVTSGTVETGDDAAYRPSSITYDPDLQRAVLTFGELPDGTAIEDLSDLPEVDAAGGAATLRLRVGSSQVEPVTLDEVSETDDTGDTFDGSRDLKIAFGSDGDSSVVVSGEVEPTAGNTVRWPGIDSPGVRNERRDAQVTGRADTNDGVDVFYYNFANLYGTDAIGLPLENAITPAQQQRTREILDLYAEHLGVQFIETEDRGLQIVTGDLRALVETANTGEGAPYQAYRVNDSDPSQGVLILDSGEDWFDGYGLSPDQRPSWFVEALRGVGSLLGIGNTFEQVPGVASGSNPQLYNPSLFPLGAGGAGDFSIEPDFLSTSDIIPGQALHRPEIRDADLYRFQVTEPGRISVESFAQRMNETSLLDTDLKLWRLDPETEQYELVARNGDFYGEDSFVGVDVAPNSGGAAATYVVGITAEGNDDYDPKVADSGGGGRSQGRYEMRITFRSDRVSTITDTQGSRLDGDSDGEQGGDFNFWFRVARDTTDADSARTIYVAKSGDDLGDGTFGSPYATIADALAEARPDDIVRLLPDGGADGRIETPADNRAYEIGRGGSGNGVLSDGETFEVPGGVTVMIDAGSILKLRNAKISVGSESIDEDRSLAALQVLGTPWLIGADGERVFDDQGNPVDGRVDFSSYHEEQRDDEGFAVDTNQLPTTPAPGDWAGIEFRNDVDNSEGRANYEREGIFLDYVSHAEIRYAGGSVSSNDPVVTPLQMLESRPTLIYNHIQDSQSAAISADPNSFEETNFHAPQYQLASLDRFGERFTSDYGRVGPLVRGNTLADNSINGLFVRVVTPAGGEREPMTVSGRFDDHDITHVLSEVLTLQGQPGGPQLLEQLPDVLSVTVDPATESGSLSEGETVDYRVTFVTKDGYESLASLPTHDIVVGASGAVALGNLPAAPEEFAGRRLYRSVGAGQYEFVAQLDRATPNYTDDGTTRGGLLSDTALADERLLPRPAARLSIDPGLVVKLDTARIEATFGADFYAEGLDGQPIVFTSRLDDSYGAGGTFDTNDDGDSAAPAPGDWGGLVFRQGSTASIDHAVIRYAGGESAVSGGLVQFNPIEILQADVRVAHSRLSDNASGNSGSVSTRDGLGFNGSGTIFVRGAQPVIVENTFIGNQGAAISINPDALNYVSVDDPGRATGAIDRYVTDGDNQGPLLAGNQLEGNAINGLLVRNESLTTESVWDDTDIVHVVEGRVYAWNHHHRSGLRLKSDPNQSLVVKLQSGGALVADRYGSEVHDSIGGTVQVIGQPGFPVVLTSIHDDTVGAGFTPSGRAQTDTDNADIAPGTDWDGIIIDAGANDRNVAFVPETERAVPAAASENAIADRGQFLGSLARGEMSADENRRLGFNVRGTLSRDGDIDVYEFTANGGTEVFLDIDDTDFGLDTVVELIDINGNILALSDNSSAESVAGVTVNNLGDRRALPLRNTGDNRVENPNPLDAGMRVVLHGNSSTVNRYFVRVRSSNLQPGDPTSQLTSSSALAEGQSQGQYQLSIRLRETDEVAGSMVRLADIRYATTAIDVAAAPSSSPLAGEFAERLDGNGLDTNDGGTNFDGTNGSGSFGNGNADPLGELSGSNRGALRVSGVLGNQIPVTNLNSQFESEMDLDVFRVDLSAGPQSPNIIPENRFVSTVFDIDYADQLARANTSLAVYTESGRLILHSRDSNIADDQGRPRNGNDMTNLDAGSAGTLDAYIGPVELQEGSYYVVVSSAQMIPESLNQLFEANPANSDVRVLPIDSVRNLAEEGFDDINIGVNGVDNLGERVGLNSRADLPTIRPLFDETSIVPYKLEDVRLFVNLDRGLTGGNNSTLISVDPFTGQLERTIGQFGQPTGDLAIRRDGELFAYSHGPASGTRSNGNTGNFLNISSADGSASSAGDDGLVYRQNNENHDGTENDDPAQLIIQALAFEPQSTNAGASVGNNPGIPSGERALAVGYRDDGGRAGEVPSEVMRNVVYSVVANNGAATNRYNGNNDRDFGNGPFQEGFGPGSNKLEMGVVDTGQFHDSPVDPVTGDVPNGGHITGIAFDPDVGRSRTLAVTDEGYVYSFNPSDRRTVDIDEDGGDSYSYVINSVNHGRVTPHPEDTASLNRGHVQFTSLTLGPQVTERSGTSGYGPYARVLFGTTADGWIYTMQIDETANSVEPAPVLYNGNSAVQMRTPGGGAISNPTGLAFSIREENLWHRTSDRDSLDNMHGVFQPPNQSRIRTGGGWSLYFGMEPGNESENTINGGASNGTLTPGGAHGSTVSRPFSLGEYSRGDKPTMYFNYFLEVENGDDYSPGNDQQVDSFRVFAAGDDGQWRLLSTNDSYRSFVNPDEYDYFADNGGIPVQELHDNTGDWRQARIDLSPLAGHTNVQLRFDFSTAGGMQSQFAAPGYLTEIQAVAGTDLGDGTRFTLLDSDDADLTTFEFVRGAAVNIPHGSTILDGQQLSFTGPGGAPTTITLTTGAPAGTNEVQFDRGSSGKEIAADIVAALNDLNPSLEATANSDQVLASEAQGFDLSPDRFGATAVTVPDPSTLDGESVTFVDSVGESTTVTLVDGAPPAEANPTEIYFDSTDDSAADVAAAIADRLDDLNPRLQTATEADELIIRVSGSVMLSPAFGSPTSSNPGTTASQYLPSGYVPVFYHQEMTSQEVRDAIRRSLAEGIGAIHPASGVSTASPENYPEYGTQRVRLYNQVYDPALVPNSSAVGFSTHLPGDERGAAGSNSVSNSQINARPGQNNNVEGVYIDDIVIGFAERGEMVYNAPVNRNFDVLPETRTRTFTDSQQPEYPNEILTGAYTLEVRDGAEYGVPNDYDPLRLRLNEQFGLGRSFDTNDRLADGAVTLIAPSGADLVDGDTFVLSNGTEQLTFEFDSDGSVAQGHVRVPFTPAGVGDDFEAEADETEAVAREIRDAINSTQSTNVLGIYAATADSRDAGPTTSSRVELFGETVRVNPSAGRFMKVDLVAEETFYGRESARTLPLVDHEDQSIEERIYHDTLARATVTDYVNGMTDTLVAVGKIGDHVGTDDANLVYRDLPSADSDIIKIFLNEGDVIDVDLDTLGWAKGTQIDTLGGEPFQNSVLEILDENGVPVEASWLFEPNADGEPHPGAWIDDFEALSSGHYYVRVSSQAFAGLLDTEGFGEYQLTIRPGDAVDRDVVMADYHMDRGDTNRFRDQGQIIIESNFIRDFGDTGIRASFDPGASTSGAEPEFPTSPLNRRVGAAATLRSPNSERLLPGTVISNNVVISDGGTGISFSGEVTPAGDSPAPAPFGRIVNNTVVGAGSGVGIDIASNAAPTVLNNLVSGFGTGLNIADNSDSTVADGNAYHDNATHSSRPLGSSSVVVSGSVFQDAGRDVYIPAEDSVVIDSSFASLNDRSRFVDTVKSPVGIARSPILAPEYDAYGIPRFDDPNVNSPGGVGSNVFIDRGAIDRADLVRPVAELVAPLDVIGGTGETAGDIDPDESYVRLSRGTVEFFEIQLLDPSGTGPDMDTITEESVLLTENGQRLEPGVDFTFGYSDNSRTIRLTPLSGLWRPDAVYEITLNNQPRISYEAPRGDRITDGDQVVITDNSGNQSVFEYDSGYSVTVPQTTLLTVTGNDMAFRDRDTFTITSPAGDAVTFEINRTGSTAASNVPIDLTDEAGTVGDVRKRILEALTGTHNGSNVAELLDIVPVAVGLDRIQLGTTAEHTVDGTAAGLDFSGQLGGVTDGETFVYSSGDTAVTFEFDLGDGTSDPDATPIPITRADTPDEIAAAIVEAVPSSLTGLSGAQAIGDGGVLLGGQPGDGLDLGNTSLSLLGTPGVSGSLRLTVPDTATGATVDGTTFDIDVDGTSVTFEYTLDPSQTSPNELIVVDSAATPDQIAEATATEIAGAFPEELAPAASGTEITLGEPPAIPEGVEAPSLTVVNAGTSGLGVEGVSGGAIPVTFLPTSQFTSAAAAATLQAAIRHSPLDVEIFSPGGGTVLIENAASVEGRIDGGALTELGTAIPAVADLAGNRVRETRINDETRFTVIMPEVVFDFGDAPDRYATTLDENGPRHAVGGERTPRLGSVLDTEADGQPVDGDDTPVQLSADVAEGVFELGDEASDSRVELTITDIAPAGGETFALWIDGTRTTFELVDSASNPSADNIAVTIGNEDGPEQIASALATEVRALLADTDGAVELSRDAATLVIESLDDEDGLSIGTFRTGGEEYRVFTQPGTDPNQVDPEDIAGFLNPLDPAGTEIDVTVTGGGLLDAWIDFNQDGVFDDDEQVLMNAPVVDGNNPLTIDVPADATKGDTWARFRVSGSGNLSPTGVAVGGEVEDYLVSIIPEATPTPNDDPEDGNEDAYTTEEDGTLSVTDAADSLIANDDNVNDQILPPRVFIVDQPANGELELINEFEGTFTYEPRDDFNGTDTFTYRLSAQEVSGNDAPESELATVTITVGEVNDPPSFDLQSTVELLEQDDGAQYTAPNVIDNAVPGPDTAEDELEEQTLSYAIDLAASNIPVELFDGDPTINSNGDLLFTPAVDAFGSAELVVTVSDDHLTDPQTVSNVITVHVRPVNDPPGIDPSRLGESDERGADDEYVVADGDDPSVPNDQEPDFGRPAGTILYTMAEDQGPFFIPLEQESGLGFHRIGLFDVISVGPQNETENRLGGPQSFLLQGTPSATTAGGSLEEVRNLSGELIGYDYTPPRDFNSSGGATDSFQYTVVDDNPGGGETWSLDQGDLIEDPMVSNGAVEIIINPVNDRPVFDVPQTSVEVAEDSGVRTIPSFATDIAAGPPTSAFDEVDVNNGQDVSFTVSSLSFPFAQADQFFSVFPSVSPSGDLTFQPAPDVFGEFEFEVVLTDTGPDNSTRGDLVSSVPETITIDVQPVNDPPERVDGDEPQVYGVRRNEPIEIPLHGTGGQEGLFDSFVVGPANEAEDIAPQPGGNQTIQFATPLPAETAEEGTVELVTGPGGEMWLRYTPANNFTGTDSFTYTVEDRGVTIDIGTGGAERDDSRLAGATVTFEVQSATSQLQNPVTPQDVNDDGFTTALDALLVINRLATAEGGDGIPVEPGDVGPPYIDVTGDGRITALDALRVINALRRQNGGEGERVGEGEAVAAPQPQQLGSEPFAETAPVGDQPPQESFASSEKVVGGSHFEPLDADVLDAIAAAHDSPDEDPDESVAAIDAAMADLL